MYGWSDAVIELVAERLGYLPTRHGFRLLTILLPRGRANVARTSHQDGRRR